MTDENFILIEAKSRRRKHSIAACGFALLAGLFAGMHSKWNNGFPGLLLLIGTLFLFALAVWHGRVWLSLRHGFSSQRDYDHEVSTEIPFLRFVWFPIAAAVLAYIVMGWIDSALGLE